MKLNYAGNKLGASISTSFLSYSIEIIGLSVIVLLSNVSTSHFS